MKKTSHTPFWSEDYYAALFLGADIGGFEFKFVDVGKTTQIINEMDNSIVAVDAKARKKHQQHLLFISEVKKGNMKLDYRGSHQLHPKTKSWRNNKYYSTGMSFSVRVHDTDGTTHDISVLRAIKLWNLAIQEFHLDESVIDEREFKMSLKIANGGEIKKAAKKDAKKDAPISISSTEEINEEANTIATSVEAFFNNLNFCHNCGRDLQPMHTLKIDFNCCPGCGFNFKTLYKEIEDNNK